MPITAKSKVVTGGRDDWGRFTRRCVEASESTVKALVETGAKTSRALAPVGKNRAAYARRPGYVPLNKSIKTFTQGNMGYWYSIAPHALYVELGTDPHWITGKLYFLWKGGFFFWNNPKYGPVGSGRNYENWDDSGAWVWHPGTNAQPFLAPAYDRVVRRQAREIMKREFKKKGL